VALECKPGDLIVSDNRTATRNVDATRNKDATRNVDATRNTDATRNEDAARGEKQLSVSNSDGFLTLTQVAERLGLSRKRVNDYVNNGKLRATKGKQNHNFVSEADLRDFIKNRG
jgi:excisionase family DNA binding protein